LWFFQGRHIVFPDVAAADFAAMFLLTEFLLHLFFGVGSSAAMAPARVNCREPPELP
jgi:hypothetical protein